MPSDNTARIFVKTTLGLSSSAGDGLGSVERRVLSLVDGQRSGIEISIASGYPLGKVEEALDALDCAGLALLLVSEPADSPSGLSGDSGEEEADDIDISSLITSAKARDAAASLAKASEKTLRSADRDAERRAIEDIYSGALGRALEAKAEREESERLALELHAAEKARKALEAEQRRLRDEIEARARAEADARERAEAERRAREEAERKARKAREEAERKARAEAERKEREAREEAARKAREEAERIAAIERARLRRIGIIRDRARNTFAFLLVALLSSGGLLSYQTSKISPGECSDMAKRWLESPIDTKSCSLSLFPSPQLTIGEITSSNGALAFREAKAEIALLPLLRGDKVVDSVRLSDGAATPDGILSLFRRARASREFANMRSFEIENLTVHIGKERLREVQARALFASNGALDQAAFRAPGGLEGKALIYGEQVIVSFTLPRPPEGMLPPGWGSLSEISAQGYLEPTRFIFDSLLAAHPSGRYTAKGEVSWSADQWKGKGDWSIVGADLPTLAPWLFSRGRASLSGTFETVAKDPYGLLSGARATGSGEAREFAVKLDIASSLGAGSGGGLSAFTNAPMATSFDGDRFTVSLPQLSSGLFTASLTAAKSSDGSVTGSAKASASAGSGTFSIKGDAQSVGLTR